MKTPEEIKRGLECCNSNKGCANACPYWDEKMGCGNDYLMDDALAYIQQLEQEKKAMLRDMKAWPACDTCKHRNVLCTQKPCSVCREAGDGKTVMWEWRGVEEENHEQ